MRGQRDGDRGSGMLGVAMNVGVVGVCGEGKRVLNPVGIVPEESAEPPEESAGGTDFVILRKHIDTFH